MSQQRKNGREFKITTIKLKIGIVWAGSPDHAQRQTSFRKIMAIW